MHTNHDHYCARSINDIRTDGGIAHDDLETICSIALTMHTRSGNAIQILSCDSNGATLETLHVVQ